MNIQDKPLGIGKKGRELLKNVLLGTKGTITPPEVVFILHCSRQQARYWLSFWTKHGWLHRIKHGLYVPVSIESETSKPSIEDPWIIAQRLFEPCYLGGWTAAQYWDFTEQIFQSIIIFTSHYIRESEQNISNVSFLIKRIDPKKFFGLEVVWRENVKVQISDPTRTIIDIFDEPRLGGGIRLIEEIFQNYLRSEHRDLDLLIKYASEIKNRTVYKRMGFLMEKIEPQEHKFIHLCQSNMSKGKTYLDPQAKGKKLHSKWQLWVSA